MVDNFSYQKHQKTNMEPNVLPFFLIGNNALSHVFSLSWCKLQMIKKKINAFSSTIHTLPTWSCWETWTLTFSPPPHDCWASSSHPNWMVNLTFSSNNHLSPCQYCAYSHSWMLPAYQHTPPRPVPSQCALLFWYLLLHGRDTANLNFMLTTTWWLSAEAV